MIGALSAGASVVACAAASLEWLAEGVASPAYVLPALRVAARGALAVAWPTSAGRALGSPRQEHVHLERMPRAQAVVVAPVPEEVGAAPALEALLAAAPVVGRPAVVGPAD